MNVGSIDLIPRTLFHGRGTVSCLPMNVYLSHNTALLFWRAWSAAAAIPLCVFHDLGVADASLFPATLFPTSEVLRNEAVLSRDVRTILEDALQSLAGADPVRPADAGSVASPDGSAASAAAVGGMLPQTTAVASALKEVVRSRGAAPLHIMVAKGHGTRNSSDLIRHRSVAAFPRQAVRRSRAMQRMEKRFLHDSEVSCADACAGILRSAGALYGECPHISGRSPAQSCNFCSFPSEPPALCPPICALRWRMVAPSS